MAFERTDKYMADITMAALDQEVLLDAEIKIIWAKGKLKAYCSNTDTFVQFPKAIRTEGRGFIADVVKAEVKGSTVFYRAFKNSIRESIKGKRSDPIA